MGFSIPGGASVLPRASDTECLVYLILVILFWGGLFVYAFLTNRERRENETGAGK